MGRAVAENRRAFEECFREDRVTYDRYLAQRVVVTRAIIVANKNGELTMGRAIGE